MQLPSQSLLGIFLLVIAPHSSLAYQHTHHHQQQQPQSVLLERRSWLSSMMLGTSAILLLSPAVSSAESSANVISSKYCASGVGDGCDDLSEGNAFIKQLQETSAKNKDRYAKEALDAYNRKNYADYFAVSGQTLVRKPDGGYMIVSDRELSQLKRDNRLTTEMPKAMNGRVTDLTQKPVLILKE